MSPGSDCILHERRARPLKQAHFLNREKQCAEQATVLPEWITCVAHELECGPSTVAKQSLWRPRSRISPSVCSVHGLETTGCTSLSKSALCPCLAAQARAPGHMSPWASPTGPKAPEIILTAIAIAMDKDGLGKVGMIVHQEIPPANGRQA